MPYQVCRTSCIAPVLPQILQAGWWPGHGSPPMVPCPVGSHLPSRPAGSLCYPALFSLPAFTAAEHLVLLWRSPWKLFKNYFWHFISSYVNGEQSQMDAGRGSSVMYKCLKDPLLAICLLGFSWCLALLSAPAAICLSSSAWGAGG